MNTTAYFALRLVHIASMAVYVGATVAAPIGMRRALALGHGGEFMERLQKTTVVIISAALVTVLTGFGLIASMGLSATPVRIWIGLGLMIGIIAIGSGLSRPTMARLSAHFAQGGDAPGAETLVRRFFVLINTELALRVTVLVLMVWKS